MHVQDLHFLGPCINLSQDVSFDEFVVEFYILHSNHEFDKKIFTKKHQLIIHLLIELFESEEH